MSLSKRPRLDGPKARWSLEAIFCIDPDVESGSPTGDRSPAGADGRTASSLISTERVEVEELGVLRALVDVEVEVLPAVTAEELMLLPPPPSANPPAAVGVTDLLPSPNPSDDLSRRSSPGGFGTAPDQSGVAGSWAGDNDVALRDAACVTESPSEVESSRKLGKLSLSSSQPAIASSAGVLPRGCPAEMAAGESSRTEPPAESDPPLSTVSSTSTGDGADTGRLRGGLRDGPVGCASLPLPADLGRGAPNRRDMALRAEPAEAARSGDGGPDWRAAGAPALLSPTPPATVAAMGVVPSGAFFGGALCAATAAVAARRLSDTKRGSSPAIQLARARPSANVLGSERSDSTMQATLSADDKEAVSSGQDTPSSVSAECPRSMAAEELRLRYATVCPPETGSRLGPVLVGALASLDSPLAIAVRMP